MLKPQTNNDSSYYPFCQYSCVFKLYMSYVSYSSYRSYPTLSKKPVNRVVEIWLASQMPPLAALPNFHYPVKSREKIFRLVNPDAQVGAPTSPMASVGVKKFYQYLFVLLMNYNFQF